MSYSPVPHQESGSELALTTIYPDVEQGNDNNVLGTAAELHVNVPESTTSSPAADMKRKSSAAGARDRAVTYSPAVPDNTPSVLAYNDLNVATKTIPKKMILQNVSGNISGGFWAIMGSSGSGKTTLLSALSLRLDHNFMDITGEFRLNGREYSKNLLKRMSAYVMKDDLLHAELTVQETLSYAAQLRMSAETTREERQARIDEVLGLMGISHCKETIIGNSRRKGISGGERKRVSVAVELLNRPKLIFLDEPTSGLDSTTALTVCETLKNLVNVGECTVVCTIHQPQPKIFNLFDNLILMRNGSIVYHGSAHKAEKFLDTLGCPTPADMSIADHLLEVISPAQDLAKLDEHARNEVPVNLHLGFEKPFYTTEGARNWWDQFTILFRRNYQQYIRNPDIILMNGVVTILMAVFVSCGLWYQIGTGQDSIPKRVPSLFFACITQGAVGSLQAINSFPSERAIMLRERQAGTYQVSSYFVAKSVVDMLSQIWLPMLFSIFVYPLIGYQKGADRFFMYMFFMSLNCMAATSLATMVTCLCVSVELSTVVMSLLFEICRLYGGFFASPMQVKEYPGWAFADVLSYIKYAFIGVAINELTDLKIDCPSGKCKYTTGEQIMKDYGYDEYSIGFCIGILFVLIVGFRFIGYVALRYIKF